MVGRQLLLEFDAEGNVENVNRKDLHKALDEARVQWKKNKLDAYSFVTYQVGGESAASEQPHPVTVNVRPGQLATMTYSQTGKPVPADATTNIPISIDHILAKIHTDIDSNVASFVAEYNNKGVPTKFCGTKILPKGKTDMDCTHISNVQAILA